MVCLVGHIPYALAKAEADVIGRCINQNMLGMRALYISWTEEDPLFDPNRKTCLDQPGGATCGGKVQSYNPIPPLKK